MNTSQNTVAELRSERSPAREKICIVFPHKIKQTDEKVVEFEIPNSSDQPLLHSSSFDALCHGLSYKERDALYDKIVRYAILETLRASIQFA